MTDAPDPSTITAIVFASIFVLSLIGGVLLAVFRQRPRQVEMERPTQNYPGWHADPTRLPCYRWWDGAQWTDHVSPTWPTSALTERTREAR